MKHPGTRIYWLASAIAALAGCAPGGSVPVERGPAADTTEVARFSLRGPSAVASLERTLRQPGDYLRRFEPRKPSLFIYQFGSLEKTATTGELAEIRAGMIFTSLTVRMRPRASRAEPGRERDCVEPGVAAFWITVGLEESEPKALDYFRSFGVLLCARPRGDETETVLTARLEDVVRGPRFKPSGWDLLRAQLAPLARAIGEAAAEEDRVPRGF